MHLVVDDLVFAIRALDAKVLLGILTNSTAPQATLEDYHVTVAEGDGELAAANEGGKVADAISAVQPWGASESARQCALAVCPPVVDSKGCLNFAHVAGFESTARSGVGGLGSVHGTRGGTRRLRRRQSHRSRTLISQGRRPKHGPTRAEREGGGRVWRRRRRSRL